MARSVDLLGAGNLSTSSASRLQRRNPERPPRHSSLRLPLAVLLHGYFPTLTEAVGTVNQFILQRYTSGTQVASTLLAQDCAKPYTGVGGQQMWKKIPNSAPYCFSVTADLDAGSMCDDLCTVQVYCARGGNSGVQMKYFAGGINGVCAGSPAKVVEYMPYLTWLQVKAYLSGGICTVRPNSGDRIMYEGFTQNWEIGVDFPDCIGYDLSTQGQASSGTVTNPEDLPMTLTFYTDSGCTQVLNGGVASINVSYNSVAGQQITQRWLSVYRNIPVAARAQSMVHCWLVEPPKSWPPRNASFRFTCKILAGRQGMYVEMFRNNLCQDAPYTEQVFYTGYGYNDLQDNQGNIVDVMDFFKGTCKRNSDGIFWKLDRPMFAEDYPDCYQFAKDNDIPINRPTMTDQNYNGPLVTVRKNIDASPRRSELSALAAVSLWLLLVSA